MTQKVIKIGSSAGVTIPKRELEARGLKVGDMVEVNVSLPNKVTIVDVKLAKFMEEFTKEYGETLRRLAKR